MKPIFKIILSTLYLITFISSVQAQAQSENENLISVNIEASEIVPADIIIFNIQLNTEASAPQLAFNEHKKLESVLVDLLKKNMILEKDITFDPIRLSYQNLNNRDNTKVARTNQSVSVSFTNFELYDSIQIALLENGFNSFNGSFSSSKIEEGKNKALVKAIELAKEKAELIAKSSGLSLIGVYFISFGDSPTTGFLKNSSFEMASMRDSSLLEFDQTMKVTANINMVFKFN